jgi:hypothetical protein
MGFLKDGAFTLGLCVGTIAILLAIIFIASAILDFDPRTTIENNTTIELNGIQITVPQTSNYTINESDALWNYNDTDKYGIEHLDEIRNGNAWSYYDYSHNITIYVAYSNRTAYSDVPDFSTMESNVDYGREGRTHYEKRTLGDKIVYVEVLEEKELSKKIVASAKTV